MNEQPTGAGWFALVKGLETVLRVLWLPALLVYLVTIGGTFAAELLAPLRVANLIIGALVIGGALLDARRTGSWPWTLDARRIAVLAIGGLIAVAAWQSRYPRLSWEVALHQWWLLAALLLVATWASDVSRWRRMEEALLIAGAVEVIWGLAQFLHWRVDPNREYEAGQRVIHGTLNHPNDFAVLLVLLAPLAFVMAVDARRRPAWRWFAGALFLLMAWHQVQTVSRIGWLTMFVAGVITVTLVARAGLMSLRPQRGVAVGLLSAAAVIVVLSFAASHNGWFLYRISSTINAGSGSPDVGTLGRVLIWRTTWRLTSRSPLTGLGPGVFPLVYASGLDREAKRELTFHPHSLFLHLCAEWGVPAAVWATVGMLVLWLTGLRRLWLSHGPDGAELAASLGAVGGYLVGLPLTSTLEIPAITTIFLIFVARLMGPPRRKAIFIDHAAAAMIAMSLIGGLGRPCARWVSAHILFDSARGRPRVEQIAILKRAVALDPGFALYHHQLGRALASESAAAAVGPLRAAARAFAGDAVIQHDLGWALIETKGASAALASLQRAVELDPAQPWGWLALGWARRHQSQSDLDGALDAYRIATEQVLVEQPAEAFYALAEVEALQERWQVAAEHCKRALELTPGAGPAFAVSVRFRRAPLFPEALPIYPRLESRAQVRRRWLVYEVRAQGIVWEGNHAPGG